jgi:hypothetical protein
MADAEFEAQWQQIAGWDWEQIERAVAREGMARLCRAPGAPRSARHPAELAPEDAQRPVPAVLAPEDIRSEVKQDGPESPPAPLSPEAVARQLYFAAALYAHCQQRGLAMGATRDPDGTVWICAKSERAPG